LAVHLAQTAWLYGKQAKSANEKLVRQAKLGASCRVKVPAE